MLLGIRQMEAARIDSLQNLYVVTASKGCAGKLVDWEAGSTYNLPAREIGMGGCGGDA